MSFGIFCVSVDICLSLFETLLLRISGRLGFCLLSRLFSSFGIVKWQVDSGKIDEIIFLYVPKDTVGACGLCRDILDVGNLFCNAHTFVEQKLHHKVL